MFFFLPSLAYLHAIQIMNHYAFLTGFFFHICLLPAVFFQLSLKHILIRTEKELTQLPTSILQCHCDTLRMLYFGCLTLLSDADGVTLNFHYVPQLLSKGEDGVRVFFSLRKLVFLIKKKNQTNLFSY